MAWDKSDGVWDALTGACESDAAALRELLEGSQKARDQLRGGAGFCAVIRAAKTRNLESLAEIARWRGPQVGSAKLLMAAAREGDLGLVRALIPLEDAGAGESEALRWATWSGSAELVLALIDASRPEDWPTALWAACSSARAECAELLATRCDSSARDRALMQAVWSASQSPFSASHQRMPALMARWCEGVVIRAACAKAAELNLPEIAQELSHVARAFEERQQMGLCAAEALGATSRPRL